MEPKVGIITINWNGSERTVRCVDSLLKQQYSPFRVYIVDNHSDHHEGYHLTDHYSGETRVKVILNPHNDGYAGGNNVGLRQAQSDGHDQGIWFLNNDATAEPGALSALVSMANDKTIGLIGSTILYPDRKTIYALAGGTFNPWTGLDHLHQTRKVFQPTDQPLTAIKYISGASLYLTASGLAACPGFDPDYFLYSEDLDLSLRIRQARLRLGYAAASVVIHESAATTGHMSATYVYYFLRNHLLLMKKRLRWFYWPSYLMIFFVYYIPGFIIVLAMKKKWGLWRYVPKAIVDFSRHRWGAQVFTGR